ncbi:hypothetical protein [Thermogymnomonas acidicola]|uniref:hypothetical protein n=1 Tax=Thermogymnomonas acidicola TaxID=399579 RepID=UPI0009464040|nr:hypothetical protein [Thermogymnomonas acidicola]
MLLASLYFLWPAAIGMVIANSISIYLARRSSTILGRLVDYLILTMMNGMLLGPLLHFIFPYYLNFPRTVEVSVFLMAAESLPFVGRFISMALNGTQGSGRPVLYLTASFVLVDEALMSIDFSLATARGAAAGYLDFAHIMDYLSSYWFVVPMGGLEMALSSVLLTRDFRREHSVTFMVQAVAMALVPTAFNQPLWVPVSIYLSGSVMTAYFIYMFEHLYRSKAVETGFSEYLLLLLLIYGFMMAGGIFLWQYSGDADILSISMLALMALYLYGALWKGALEGRKRYWTVDARWTLLFMLLVFFAEFFMGAVFDAQFFGGARQFVSSLSLVAIHGGVSGKIASSLYDGFMFLAEISLSTWFLVMMGIEMGSLGYFKAREARNTENKVRLYLMIAAYGIYSVLLPDFIIPNPSAVPFIGWSMGIGTGGGLLRLCSYCRYCSPT